MIVAMGVVVLIPRWAAAQQVTLIGLTSRAVIAHATFDAPKPADPSDSNASMMAFHRVSPTMQSLYVMTALTQALDAQSTFKALNAGAVESNSLVKPFAANRPAFLALKAGMATAFIYAGHDLSKGHKIGAMVALALVNSVYTAITVNNYRVVHAMDRRR